VGYMGGGSAVCEWVSELVVLAGDGGGAYVSPN
jgi:hypothetical protein